MTPPNPPNSKNKEQQLPFWGILSWPTLGFLNCTVGWKSEHGGRTPASHQGLVGPRRHPARGSSSLLTLYKPGCLPIALVLLGSSPQPASPSITSLYLTMRTQTHRFCDLSTSFRVSYLDMCHHPSHDMLSEHRADVLQSQLCATYINIRPKRVSLSRPKPDSVFAGQYG